MTSVHFPTDLGGDGLTITDDANPDTGLAAGGHRVRFLPALSNVVALSRVVHDRATAAEDFAARCAELRNESAVSQRAAAERAAAAGRSATAAAESASAAGSSKTAAAESASAAGKSASAASRSATSTSASETAAAESAAAAGNSETAAASSATAANESATVASESAEAAADSATAADKSATAAGNSETAAASSAREATQSAGESQEWASLAEQRAVNAVVFQGVWDASTGVLPPEPTGASYWLVSGAPDGVTIEGVEYRNKDQLIWSPGEGGGWAKIDNTDAVSSVNGRRGAVVVTDADVGATAQDILTKLKTVDGKASGLDAASVHGMQFDQGVYGQFAYMPHVRMGGVMEIGRIIDFHRTGSTADYDIRLDVERGDLLIEDVNRKKLASFKGEVWHTPTLINRWEIYSNDGSWPKPCFRRTAEGYVQIAGLVAKSGKPISGSDIFRLPAGYRPQKRVLAITTGHLQGEGRLHLRIDINTNGMVHFSIENVDANNAIWVALDNIPLFYAGL